VGALVENVDPNAFGGFKKSVEMEAKVWRNGIEKERGRKPLTKGNGYQYHGTDKRRKNRTRNPRRMGPGGTTRDREIRGRGEKRGTLSEKKVEKEKL